MSSAPGRGHVRLLALLVSAEFARVYATTAIGAVFASFAIEHVSSRVTYATIVTGLCLLGLGALIARRREISIVSLVPTTLLVFLAWLFASVFWSTNARLSVVGWISTVGIAFIAVALGQLRDTLQTARALGDVLRALLAVSLGVEILSGILLDTPLRFLGIRGDIAELGPIQGIFGTRNMLGFVAVLAIITFLIEYRTQSVRVGTSVASVVLAGALAALSNSPTVLVLAVSVGAASAALWLVRHAPLRHRTTLQWALGGAVVLSVAIVYVARTPVIGLINAGRDFSLRADLWAAMADYVRLRPVHGWGWYGPWEPAELPFNLINFRLDTSRTTGLNAYMDVLLQVGWVGLLLFLAFVGTAVVRAWLDASERHSVVYAWTPLMLVALLVDSLFESFTLAGPGWLMLVLLAVNAGRSRSWRQRVDRSPLDLPELSDGP